MLFKGQTLGKYRILSPLGSGGFGTVYLARDTWLDKQVAIKVPQRQNLDFSELLREPRLLASVNHPNIVAITTADKQDDVFFIVMEYVAGETLESVLERDGALDLPRALDYTVQIGNAVDHAHKQGVIHRDLRPANVLVLDEPSSNLDPTARREFAEIVLTLGLTTVIVTHDLLYALQLCPRSVIMDAGRIVADGPTRQILGDADLLASHRLELPVGAVVQE